jgi:Fe2+ or Zn2+ uptake regulation protein
LSAREIVLSVMNASARPLRREEVVDIVRDEYHHSCHEATVYKWLGQLAKQGRVIKLAPALYANHSAAANWREEEA